MTACILSERRAVRPFGILGGGAALAGVNLLLTADGRQVSLGGKNEVQLKGGERLRILTPGGMPSSTISDNCQALKAGMQSTRFKRGINAIALLLCTTMYQRSL